MTLIEFTPKTKVDRALIEQHGSTWTEYKAPWSPVDRGDERVLIGSLDGTKTHWIVGTQITEELSDDDTVDGNQEHGEGSTAQEGPDLAVCAC